jgi:hypothetical protein
MKARHPKNRYSERPFRLWDPKLKRNIPRRYYSDARRAHDRALTLCHWDCKAGEVIEVYSARNGLLLGVYKRGTGSVEFTRIRKDGL